MPQIEITCYGCSNKIEIIPAQLTRFMEEYNYCDIDECDEETCTECGFNCDKCMGIFCKEHFNGATRMCIECDPKEENN